MARYTSLPLLSNANATGVAFGWAGFRGSFVVEGTFGGATVKLQFQTPNMTWIDVDSSNAALTAPGMVGFECPPGNIRAFVSGGTPSGLYAYAITNDDY